MASWSRRELLASLCERDPEDVPTSPDEWDDDLHHAAQRVATANRNGKLALSYFRAATGDDPYGDYDVERAEAVQGIAAQRQPPTEAGYPVPPSGACPHAGPRSRTWQR